MAAPKPGISLPPPVMTMCRATGSRTSTQQASKLLIKIPLAPKYSSCITVNRATKQNNGYSNSWDSFLTTSGYGSVSNNLPPKLDTPVTILFKHCCRWSERTMNLREPNPSAGWTVTSSMFADDVMDGLDSGKGSTAVVNASSEQQASRSKSS